MSRNLSVCHDGFLDLGYDGVSFPSLMQSSSGYLSGMFIDFFFDAARLLGCARGPRYVEFPTNSTICNNGMCYNDFDRAIHSGEVVTSALSIYLYPESIYKYAYTVPITVNMKVVFLERIPSLALDIRLIFFTVFTYDALLAILLLLLTIAAIEFVQNRVRKRFGSSPKFIKHLNLPGASLILFGLALLGYAYQAKYNGNNTTVRRDAKTIQTALSLVGSGVERFVFPDSSLFTNDEHPPHSTLSAFYSSEVLRFSDMNDINRWCRLSSIPFDPRGAALPVAWLNTSMLTGDSYQFVTSRRIPRKTIETLSFLILSVYNYDQARVHSQSTILLRKFVTKLSLAEQILNGEAEFTVDSSPFSMMQLELPLIFLSIGLTASCAAFLIEWLYLPYFKRLLSEFPKSGVPSVSVDV